MKRILLLFCLVLTVPDLSAQTDYMKQASAAKSKGDYLTAAALYEKAIEAGQNAYYDIASLYEYSLDDEATAAKWYRRGANEANDPYCQGCLADALRDGRGLKADGKEAAQWYVKAAQYWDSSDESGAAEYAFQYYKSASELGNVVAMRKLAGMYSTGRGTASNAKMANQWLALADRVSAAAEAKPEENKEPAKPVANLPAENPEPQKMTGVREDSYSAFAKLYVEEKINEWQKKDEFEKTDAWKKRVAEGRDAQVASYAAKAEAMYLAQEGAKWTFIPGETLTLGTYDSDNEVFLIHHDHFGDMLLEVPINRAPEFKMDWEKQQVANTFYVNSDTLAVATLRFENPRTSDVFTFSDKKSLNYSLAQINYNFAAIDFTPTTSKTRVKGEQSVSVNNVSIGGSDVDIDIPENKTRNELTFAVIIGNENYQTESSVEFATNDAVAMGQYCIKTLGMPESNVRVVTDATLNNMRRELNWLTTVSKSYGGEATILFYYSGHGVPDEAEKTSYLLPVDGYGMDVTTGYRLEDIYAQLTGCNSKKSIVLLDACFSGSARTGEMMHAARGIALKVKPVAAPTRGNLLVLSAASGDETAYPFARQQHGMFTYFLLSKLNSTKGSAKFGELFDFIKDNVSRKSIVENNKLQTPSFTVTDDLRDKWRNLSFR